MKKFYLLSIITLVTLISACKKDSSIGADILPATDLLNVRYTDTFTLNAKTLADTFLRTDKLAKNFLGVINNDPLFGYQKASVVMELDRPNTTYDDTLGPFTLDSVVLFLKYNAIYGDTTVPQSFSVSTLNNTVNENIPYYSNTTSFPASNQIGSISNYYFQPSVPVKTFTTDSLGTAGILRIKLNNYVGYSILNLGQNILRDSSRFKNSFPGLVVENSTASGNAMAEINMVSTNSDMSIFYKDKYGNSRQMKLYANLLKVVNGILASRQNSINLFTNTLSSNIQSTISSGNTSDAVNYILGQGGTTVKLSLPTLSQLGKVAVNKAEIRVFQIVQNSSKDLQVPSYLVLLKRNSSGQLDILPTNDGVGLLDSTLTDDLGNKISVYTFNISQYIQNISKGLETNTDLYIGTYRAGGTDGTVNLLNSTINGSIVNFSYTPSRAVIAGPTYADPRYRMKLNITYTVIK